ncbi:MAG: RHS repeat protein [bacterium]|nr:RHS repeat protein [bacterium]
MPSIDYFYLADANDPVDPNKFPANVGYILPQAGAGKVRLEWVSDDGQQTEPIWIGNQVDVTGFTGQRAITVVGPSPPGKPNVRLTLFVCSGDDPGFAKAVEEARFPGDSTPPPRDEKNKADDPVPSGKGMCPIPEEGAPVRLTNGNMRYTDHDPLPSPLPGIAARTYDSINTDVGAFGRGWWSLFDAKVVDHGDDLYEVITETNFSTFFSRPFALSRQEWPLGGHAGRLSRVDMNDPYSPYVYTEPDGDLVRTFQVVDGTSEAKLISIESHSTGEGVFIAYDAQNRPDTVSDAHSNVLWTVTADATGRVTFINAADTATDWEFTYIGDFLDEVLVDNALWRSYTYTNDLLSKVEDSRRIIEEHIYYDPGHPYEGWAMTSRVADENVTLIQYDVVPTDPLRPINTDAGEYVARVTWASGLQSEYYIRPFEDRPHQVVEIRGMCPCNGDGEFTVLGYDRYGHRVRKQDSSGYITTWTYDLLNRVRSESRGIAPPGCDPANDPEGNHCRVESTDDLMSLDLASAVPESWASYRYDDLKWLYRRTQICRESVFESAAATCQNFEYDVATGTLLKSETTGSTWDHESTPPGPKSPETLTTVSDLYNGLETAAVHGFDPNVFHTGGNLSFTPAMAAGPQPQGKLKSVDGPLTGSSDRADYVYYPTDFSVQVDARLRGRLAARKDPGDLVTVYNDYDLSGNVTSIIDPRGVVTTFSYNTKGQLETSTIKENCGEYPCNQDLITSYAYYPNGQLESMISPEGGTTIYTYDPTWGRREAVSRRGSDGTDPLEKIAYAYNPDYMDPADYAGPATSETTWIGDGIEQTRQVDYEYNANGRLWRLMRPAADGDLDPSVEEYEYDAAGNLEFYEDPLHYSDIDSTPNVKYTYDALGRLTEVQQLADPGEWAVTSYEYDAHGNLTKVTDANGNETTYGIDDFGQTYLIDSPVTGMTELRYDIAGRLTQKTDARGVIEEREYDTVNGRLNTVTYSDGPNAVEVDYSYNTVGQRAQADVVDNGTTVSTQKWTAFGRRGAVLTAEQEIAGGDPVVTSYEYNLDGNLVKQTRGCEEISYELDYAGRPIRVSGTPSDCSGRKLVFADDIQYLPFGPMNSLVHGGVEEAFTFDWQYRLKTQSADLKMPTLPGPIGITVQTTQNFNFSAQNARVSAFADRVYDYDKSGNLEAVLDMAQPQRTRTYTYDDLGRLETTLAPNSFGELQFAYDLIGNRTQKVFGEVGNQVATEYDYKTDPTTSTLTPLMDTIEVTPPGGTINLGHDDVGNLLTDENSTYTYTPRNDLATQSTGGTQRFNFLYNANGIRVRTIGSDPAGSKVDHYLDLGGRPAYEVVDNGTTTTERSFVYLGGRLLARFDEQGNIENLISDHIGYPLATFANDGELLWEAEALPFGEVHDVLHGDETTDPLLRYPGQFALDAFGGTGNTELFYNQHRWYRPSWGRYTQSDPVRDVLLSMAASEPISRFFSVGELSLSTYDYGEGNPELYSDASGLQAIDFGQSFGCDRIPPCLENDARIQCCHCHDGCYFMFGCTADSWRHTMILLSGFGSMNDCDGCNLWVVKCFADSLRGIVHHTCPLAPVSDRMFRW